MPYLNDEAYDGGLDWVVANGGTLHLCSQEPTTYAEANATYELGQASVTLGAIADGATSGRRTTVPAAAVTASATGTATHWAITDGTSVLVATNAFAASFGTTNGIVANTAAFDITLTDAVSV